MSHSTSHRTVVLALSLALLAHGTTASARNKGPKKPNKSGIEHIVVVTMENRSFDHLLGWHPTANGMQAGLAYPDESGALIPTAPLAPDYMGCGHPDPDHSWEGSRVAYDGGAMDGFLLAGQNDAFAIGYYEEADRPFFNALALEYTTFDNFFSATLGSTYPNRIFLHAAQTDRLDNSLALSTLPTIWDRLADHGVSARYYYSDISFLWLWGGKYEPISASYDQFLADAAAGTLPAVAYVEPRLLGEEEGLSGDDHPHADVRVGDAFLAETFRALANGPDWDSTVLIVTYDEGGGFFDHVAPPRAVAPNAVDPDLVNGKALLGFRLPVVVASPFTRGGRTDPRVDSTLFDNTSILKLIEWRWNLRPLTARDASGDVGNLVTALDIGHPDPAVPVLPAPQEPLVIPCALAPAAESGEIELGDLIALAPLAAATAPR